MADRSMSGWTEKSLNDKAKRDAYNDRYDPPSSWTPFTKVEKGTKARTLYDDAFRYYQTAKKRA